MPGILERLRSMLGGSTGDEAVEADAAADQVELERELARAKAVEQMTDIPDISEDVRIPD